LQPAEWAKASLLKEGNYVAAKALAYLVCGAVHDPHIVESRPRLEQYCHRCKSGAITTVKHMCWECPANDLTQDPFILKFNRTRKHAPAGFDEWSCLYARGIVPNLLNSFPCDIVI
jgi:hypothetical protein